MHSSRLAGMAAALGGVLLALFLVAPLVYLVAAGASGLGEALHDMELARSIALTVAAAAASTLVAALAGTGLAYALARRTLPGGALVAAALDLPLLVPHPVAGIAILLLVSRDTALGAALLALGVRVVGSPVGIIAAMLFVSAPLYVGGAREAFARVDRQYETVARTLGDTPWGAFRRVTLPLALRALAAAAIAAWARAVSEFGAVVVLAYTPKVASVLSYERFTTGGLRDALPVASALVLVSLLPLVALRALQGHRATGYAP